MIGLAIAACIGTVARRAGALTGGGAFVATLIGAAALSAGWSWGALLLLYFVASTLISRAGRAEKERRTASIVEKGGARDAIQVLANGALFAGAALAMAWLPNTRWFALGAGSLAAATADTWATEIGTLAGGTPRSILTAEETPIGTSGGVTALGTLGAVAGAVFIALLVFAFGWPSRTARVVFVAGFFGALVDSVLGATLQARRWCDACDIVTERTTHHCGAPTTPRGGLGWLDNDAVNFLSNAAGGILAALLMWI